ncbi:MAG: N-acetyl-lysine deacetylase [Thermoproteota archaeon]|nr:MAG: N-acetyl-lysine deacetylase [Candidatus Korarchaeota archaeon]
MRKVEEVLLRLLKAYSPTGREKQAEGELLKISRDLGLEAEVDEVGNVLMGRGEEVWLVGHYDTVPGKLPVAKEGELLKGRGAVDAKGPLAAMIVAAASLKDTPVRVAALVAEEGDSRGAKHILKNLEASYVIIGEPTNTTGIAVAYRGSVKILLECRAEASHSSSPGKSAVDKLIEAILEIKKAAPGASYSTPSAAVTLIRGGSGYSTLPKKAIAKIDLRIPLGTSSSELISKLPKPPEGCKLTVTSAIDPVSVPPSSPVPRALARALLKQGIKPRLLRKYGTSDMNLIHPKVKSIAAYGPGESRLAHTDKEKVSIKDLETAVKTYMEAAKELSKLKQT